MELPKIKQEKCRMKLKFDTQDGCRQIALLTRHLPDGTFGGRIKQNMEN